MLAVAAFCLIACLSAPAAAQTAHSACEEAGGAPPDVNGPQWNGWSPNANNARFQDAASAGLSADSVKALKLKWAFDLGDVTEGRAQPVIIGGRLFTTAQNKAAYALDAATGCLHWQYQAEAPLRTGVTFGNANGTPAVFFGDAKGTMYALDADNGRLIWKSKPVAHPASMITATPRFFEGVVYQPISSNEERRAANPGYPCCTFRGSVVALDAGTGKTIWRAFTIEQEPGPLRTGEPGAQQYGPSGAAVWSSPTIDPQRGALYVATGDNYSDPPTETSDAVLAVDLKTGKLLWSRQLTAGDTYNDSCSRPGKPNCPANAGPDTDFGQPPILVTLDGGKSELMIAQKSGMAYALDPDRRGEVLWRTRAGEGGFLGGSQWGSASDGHKMYVAISGETVRIPKEAATDDTRRGRFELDPLKGGGLVALDLATGNIVWKAQPPTPPICPPNSTNCSPAQSAAVTVIPGVVFSGSVDGHLRAYSTQNGEVLWDVNTAQAYQAVNGEIAYGGSMDSAGPAVVSGMVFADSGYDQWGGMPGNVLLAFSIDRQ